MIGKQWILAGVCAVCLVAALALAVQSRIWAAAESPAAGFSIAWWTVDGGGGATPENGAAQGGSYLLRGSLGQPDAAVSAGGNYIVTGGFWSQTVEERLYLPMIEK